MTQEAERIRTNLLKYPFIKKFLGGIIEQRLGINGFEYGMLTANLLSDDEGTKLDLNRLDNTLNLGGFNCIDFKRIFRLGRLPQNQEFADGRITDMLSEVKAFEFLHSQVFCDITNVKRKSSAKTVDFTAKRNSQNYAVEVTRLGLAQADRKKPRHIVEDNLIRHTISNEDKLVGEWVGKWFLTSGKENIPRIIEAIRDVISRKLPQVKYFCQIQGGDWNVILIISTGRDYFVMNKFAKTEFEMHQNAVEEALKKVWNLLKEEQGDFKYLHNVVITIGKDLEKAIIYPEL